jgi:hypothetical protein
MSCSAMTASPTCYQLLHGPYEPPPLHRGDRVTCELRGDIAITSISAGRIAWPRYGGIGRRGGSSLLLTGSLVHAVRHEAAAAVGFWRGVGEDVVWRWRKALDVTRTNNEGWQRLIRSAAEAGAEAIKAREWTEAKRKKRRRQAKRLGLIEYPRTVYLRECAWTAEELALLGTLPDDEVAAMIGRTTNAVRLMRTTRGIPTARDRRRTGG